MSKIVHNKVYPPETTVTLKSLKDGAISVRIRIPVDSHKETAKLNSDTAQSQ